jgi:hypothetical protein
MKQYEEKVMEYVQKSVLTSFLWFLIPTIVCIISFQFIDSTNKDVQSISTLGAILSFLIAVGGIFYCKHYCVLFRHPKKIKIYNTYILGFETDFDRGCHYAIAQGEKEKSVIRVFISDEEKKKYSKDDKIVVAKYQGLPLIEEINEYKGDKFTRVNCQ